MPQRTSADVAKYLDRIQGNILEGFNKDYQNFLFLQFVDPTLARKWLADIVNEVSSVEEVRDFNRLFKKLRNRRGGELGLLKATWMNIAFSFAGLKTLGAAGIDLFPEAFKAGMKARAAELGDVGPSDPKEWIAPFQDVGTDAVMIIAADSKADLGEHTLRYVHNMGLNGGVRLLYLQEGSVREDEPGHEHFGFRDGVSQPGVRFYDKHVKNGDPIQGDPGSDRLHPGEFLLGYPTQKPAPKPCGKNSKGEPVFFSPNPDEGPISPAHDGGDETAPDWAADGSYLVFRRLAQDVRKFRQFIAKESLTVYPDLAAKDPLTAYDVMGAKIVGRYRSGCPLELTKDQKTLMAASALPSDFDPAAGDPSLAFADVLGDNCPVSGVVKGVEVGNYAEDSRYDNNFEYGDDADGLVVPRGSHVRKVYPRDSPTPGGGESDTQTHRILRRGIPFGTSFRPSLGATGHGGKPGVEEPGDRGLLFLCYQSSLERQFEFIQQNWVNNVNFPGNAVEKPDPADVAAGLEKSDMDSADPDGEDPVIATSLEGPIKVPLAAGKPPTAARFSMPHFVTTTGGDYYFQPSIEALYSALICQPSPFPAGGSDAAPFHDTAGGIDEPGFDQCKWAKEDSEAG